MFAHRRARRAHRRAHRSTRRTVAIAAVATALVLTSCSTPSTGGNAPASSTPGVTDDTVTIGTHTPLTGPAAPGYASVSAGALAYFAYVNDNGGVHGRKINYIVKDDGYNPANTQMVVRELVQDDQVFAIFNGLGTPTHSSVIDFLNDNGVPDLFVSSGSTTWNQPKKYPNLFPFNANYVVEGSALGQYATDELTGQTACFLGQDDDLGGDMRRGAELVLGEGGLAQVEEYSTSNADLTAQVGALKSAGCEVVILAAIPGFVALSLTTAARLDWSPTWITSSVGSDQLVLLDLLGEGGAGLLEGLVSTGYLQSADEDNGWSELFRQINTDYNSDAPFTGAVFNGMSSAYLFTEALYAAGQEPTRESIVEAITSGKLVGNGMFPLSFKKDDYSSFRGVGIAVIRDGLQKFEGTAYRLDGDKVTAVEPEPVPLVGKGIPGL